MKNNKGIIVERRLEMLVCINSFFEDGTEKEDYDDYIKDIGNSSFINKWKYR